MTQETFQVPEGMPQTPDQADDASVQPTTITAEDIRREVCEGVLE